MITYWSVAFNVILQATYISVPSPHFTCHISADLREDWAVLLRDGGSPPPPWKVQQKKGFMMPDWGYLKKIECTIIFFGEIPHFRGTIQGQKPRMKK